MPLRRDEKKYKAYRNVLVKTVRDAKKLYIEESLHKNRGDGKATWGLLNQILNRTSTKQNNFPNKFYGDQDEEYGHSHIPDGFNNFFSTVGKKLDDKIPKTDGNPLQHLPNPNAEINRALPQITSRELETIIKTLNKVGGGIDMLSTQILLGTFKNIVDDLTFFFNLCLKTAVFPKNLKTAIITPIHKSGRKDKFDNHRPISIVPVLSKILEKIIHFVLYLYGYKYSELF